MATDDDAHKTAVHPVPLDPVIAEWIAALDDDAREFFHERAGIREFDGGLSRLDAESAAREDVERWLRGNAA